MTNPFPHNTSASSSQRKPPTPLAIAAAIALLIVIPLARAGRLSRAQQHWLLLVLGIVFALHVASDIRRGRTGTKYHSNDPLDDTVRSEDASGFWFLIALKGAVAVAALGWAFGGFLGIWKF